MSHRLIPDLVYNQVLTILSPGCTVVAAARAMAERNIGAVIVADQGQLVGIFTERDLTQRVVARWLDPATVVLRDVMTRKPATIATHTSPSEALNMMRSLGCRHLPVVDGERIVGMLSIRDLYAALHTDLEEDIRLRDELFMGSGYSLTH